MVPAGNVAGAVKRLVADDVAGLSGRQRIGWLVEVHRPSGGGPSGVGPVAVGPVVVAAAAVLLAVVPLAADLSSPEQAAAIVIVTTAYGQKSRHSHHPEPPGYPWVTTVSASEPRWGHPSVNPPAWRPGVWERPAGRRRVRIGRPRPSPDPGRCGPRAILVGRHRAAGRTASVPAPPVRPARPALLGTRTPDDPPRDGGRRAKRSPSCHG